MEKVYASFPDDPGAAAFYALAHLAAAPSNTISQAHSERAAEILRRVYERNPDHPGAKHYLIHANDVPGRERESLEMRSRASTNWSLRAIRTRFICRPTFIPRSETGTG